MGSVVVPLKREIFFRMSAEDEVYKRQLVERYLAGEATESELMAFFGLLDRNELDGLIESYMDAEILAIRSEASIKPRQSPVRWGRYAAAASIIISLGLFGGWFLFKNSNNAAQQVVAAKRSVILPGSQKAILTLSNGQQISLSDAKAGAIAQQGNVNIIKNADGSVAYHAGGNSANGAGDQEMAYNTITTPRGGFYPLKMADGTVAILDAGSSIKYPVTFTGNERLVEITGQVYFEVVHNAKMPFRLKVKGQVIEDLGTVFNVNAYNDEPNVKTTLVEGSVRVNKGTASILMKPGEQVVAHLTDDKLQKRFVNVDDVVAWKNGQTSFKNEELGEIMRQVSRWYDVDVEFLGDVPKTTFDGGISRKASLNDMLKILEFNDVKFKVEGKKIIVRP
jgi:transmembrane sensor